MVGIWVRSSISKWRSIQSTKEKPVLLHYAMAIYSATSLQQQASNEAPNQASGWWLSWMVLCDLVDWFMPHRMPLTGGTPLSLRLLLLQMPSGKRMVGGWCQTWLEVASGCGLRVCTEPSQGARSTFWLNK